MQGEFKGDFTRDTFDPDKNYTRVLMQQGRVLLDQDWNEQVAITLDYLRSLAKGIFGDHGGPDENAFKVTPGVANTEGADKYNIGKGQYYVEGWLCNYTSDKTLTINSNNGSSILVYLDVWERHVTYLDDKAIREVALGGPDTTSRAKLVSVVKYVDCGAEDNLAENYKTVIEKIDPNKPTTGKLAARARRENADDEPCSISPEAKYRGSENHLYRVEIHQPGSASQATFKWSRDNGSVVFPILSSGINQVTLTHLGRDSATSLKVNDWVEILTDTMIQNSQCGILVQVVSIDPVNMIVYFEQSDIGDKPILLRRWDQEGANIQNGVSLSSANNWIPLEMGIEVHFETGKHYKSGDYWLIPARTATGDIEWLNDQNSSLQEPHGIKHYYAPLAKVQNGDVTDLRSINSKRLIERRSYTIPPSTYSNITIPFAKKMPGRKDFLSVKPTPNTDNINAVYWWKVNESYNQVYYIFANSGNEPVAVSIEYYECTV